MCVHACVYACVRVCVGVWMGVWVDCLCVCLNNQTYLNKLKHDPSQLYVKYIIENTETDLRCEPNEVINITEAVYRQSVCSNKTNDCKNITDSLQQVKEECQGIQRCTFTVTNGFIGGEPCVGRRKELFLLYECVMIPGSV